MIAQNSLSPRLQALFDVVERVQQHDRYDNVWDCCCDHGYLGIKVLSEGCCETVYFVDQIPHITQDLEGKLSSYPMSRYAVITKDAGALEFSSNQRHLVILAGVNGKSAISIVNTIMANHAHEQIDFLLCPTNAQYDVREYLLEQDFSLAFEMIVADKKHQYEVIYVRAKIESTRHKNVSLIGAMWDEGNPEHQRYLTNTIAHYQRAIQGGERRRSIDILQRYQACFDDIFCKSSVTKFTTTKYT